MVEAKPHHNVTTLTPSDASSEQRRDKDGLAEVFKVVRAESREGGCVLIGILITTVGISLLTLGLVGASIQVYSQLLSAMVQQQVFGLTEQLPEILRPEGSDAAGGTDPSGSTQILLSLIENLINSPLWLIISVVGIALIYLGLYITQRQRLGYRPLSTVRGSGPGRL